MNEDNPEPGVAHLLRAQAKRRQLAAGREADDLQEIAQWFDGDLSPEERARIAARVESDPELAAVVKTLRLHDTRGSEAGTRQAPLPSNVVSLSERARRLPERRPGPTRKLLVGAGSVLAIAAIAFVATRPATEAPTTTHGAALASGSAVTVRASFTGASPCEVSGLLSAPSPMALWYVADGVAVRLGEHAAGPFRVAPTCSQTTCEVLIATPLSSGAPAIDPMTCAPTDPTSAGIRLQR